MLRCITYPVSVFSLLLLCTALLLSSCKKDDPVTMQPPRDTDTQPQQYGNPFQEVPSIAAINLYEVNPRVFSPEQNLDGITGRLEAIEKLGVNVIWLMPIYPTGDERSVGSPYAVKDYLAVHEDYGTLEDLRELVDKAHELGMAVILDWVANHTAWDHDWIDNPSWYIRDGNGNIIHPPGTNWMDVAELNYDNNDMRDAMISAMKYWVLEANVDGYRCDFAGGAPVDFWTAAIDSLRSIPERELILFAESNEKDLLAADFDMLFGWAFYDRLKRVFNGNPAQQIYYTHTEEYEGLGDHQHIVRWITNHDQHAWEATPRQLFGSPEASLAAFVIASTMGGVPLVYNGQEVAVPYQLPFFEGQEVFIDWGLNPGITTAYEQLLQLRQQSEALQQGALSDYSSSTVVAFTRQQESNTVLILVNVRNTAQSYTLPPEIADTAWKNALTAEDVAFGDTVELDAYQYIVLTKP